MPNPLLSASVRPCRRPLPLLVVAMLVLLTVCPSLAAPPRRAEAPVEADKTLSPYFVVLGADSDTEPLPLKDTRVEAAIAGTVAEVKVTQVYQNRGKKTLEAIYVFPASSRAAVNAMRMTVGERVVEAEIMERKAARETYEAAKKQGQTASLLEQQRPNVFQMNVANILPGDEIKVELKYFELLKPEEKVYEFVFPTVVGPRYSDQPAAGAPDTEKWVKSPYLHEGQPPPATVGIAVTLKSGLPIAKLASPSHEVEVNYEGPATAKVRLKDEKTAGNKDFVLRYTLAGDKIQTGLLLYPGKEENFFLMMMEPPERVAAEAVVPREYIFIVDVSGSMHGFPLEISKALMKDIFTGLRPQDFMNVLLFESGNAVLSETGSLPASEANKEKALAFINAQPGGGGTQILPALKRALALPRTPNTSRIVVIATDGYVHVEPQTFETIRQNLGEANLFAFGTGKSVNRHIIEGMARAGRGEPFILLNPAEAPKQAARFQQYVASPVLTNLKVAFQGFEAYDVEPVALPDLFALRPIALMGKYKDKPAGAILVQGRTAKGPFQQKVAVEERQAGSENAALRLLWARERIIRLSDFAGSQQEEGRVKEITGLGLKYSLMTAYTSFVAVDKVKRADGQIVTVKQPLPLPEGVSDLAVGGGMMRAAKMMSPMAQYTQESVATGVGTRGREEGLVSADKEMATPSFTVQVLKAAGVDVAQVQKALEADLAKLAACLREAQGKGVKLPKEITFTFALGPGGKVAQDKGLKLSLKNEALKQCLLKALAGIVFPAPAKGPATVTVKLVAESR